MSKKSEKSTVSNAESTVSAEKTLAAAYEARIATLEQRLAKIERRTKSNERFARTMSETLGTQVVAIDAVTSVMRRSLQDDATIQAELVSAIHEYDRHKVRRWLSGFCSVVLWVVSVAVAAFVGALIYWTFSGQ